MADTTYKGDSPGKALIRIRAWSAIRATMSRLGIPFQGAMVLAGEGGDLGVMDGMGFPMNKVVAVDRDPFMVDWCKHHYPDVIPGKGELMDVAASGILPYNTAHIDMCGGVRLVDNLITVARVARGIHTHPAVIAVTMLKGREAKARCGLMDGVYRGTRERLMKAARKKGDALAEHVYSGKKWDSLKMRKLVEGLMKEGAEEHPEMGVGIFKKNGRLTSLGMGMSRAVLLHHVVEYLWEAWDEQGSSTLPMGQKLHMQQAGVMVYHSGTKDDGKDGMPYVTVLYLIYNTPQMSWVQNWMHRAGEHHRRTGETGGVFPYETLTFKTAMESFKPTIAAMARIQDHDKVATMFGINVKSIPAILAHDTRGSYNGKALWRPQRVLLPSDQQDLGWGGHEATDEDVKIIRGKMTQELEAWVAAGNTVESFPGFGEIVLTPTEGS